MDRIDNVSIIKKANIYLDGKVTSRTVILPDGKTVTLGIMLPGDYEFTTSDQENMEVISGSMKVLLPGETKWKVFNEGKVFSIPSNSTFKLEINEVSDYFCTFGKVE